jgi:hypothetical protein
MMVTISSVKYRQVTRGRVASALATLVKWGKQLALVLRGSASKGSGYPI